MALAAVTAVLIPATSHAQDVKPLLDARLRWENVDQDGFGRSANAITFRLRAGADMTAGDWSALAEGEATISVIGSYDSGVNGKLSYPIVADPENVELNRLQVQYRGLPATVVTLGRQRINIEDQRFVGAVGWRQNEQTFDAIRIEHGDGKGLKADFAFSWSGRTIWGIDGHDARQQAIGGNYVFASISHPTPAGTLSGFAFLVDQDESQVQGFRLSSQTYGIRLAGSRNLSRTAKLNYVLSYASQSDFHRNPTDYRADYWLVDFALDLGPMKLGLGYEELGANDGSAVTSFQTPLATLHKFQGWADKFLVTPPNGIRDWYASAGYSWKKAANFDAITATLVYHRFESDRIDLRYGSEWDAQLLAKRGRWTATAKLAAYKADGFAAGTRKLWIQLDWSL